MGRADGRRWSASAETACRLCMTGGRGRAEGISGGRMTRIVFDTGGWIDTEADAIELLNAIGTENAPEYICVATAHGNAIIRTGCIMYMI